MTANPLQRLSLHSIGFDQLINELHDNRKQPTYPPYNIIKVDEDKFSVEMALSGFQRDDLTLRIDGNKLTVATNEEFDKKQSGISDQSEYLHRGIAKRKFSTDFTLAKNIEVQSAEMKDGLLIIGLAIPEDKKPQEIAIS